MLLGQKGVCECTVQRGVPSRSVLCVGGPLTPRGVRGCAAATLWHTFSMRAAGGVFEREGGREGEKRQLQQSCSAAIVRCAGLGVGRKPRTHNTHRVLFKQYKASRDGVRCLDEFVCLSLLGCQVEHGMARHRVREGLRALALSCVSNMRAGVRCLHQPKQWCLERFV